MAQASQAVVLVLGQATFTVRLRCGASWGFRFFRCATRRKANQHRQHNGSNHLHGSNDAGLLQENCAPPVSAKRYRSTFQATGCRNRRSPRRSSFRSCAVRTRPILVNGQVHLLVKAAPTAAFLRRGFVNGYVSLPRRGSYRHSGRTFPLTVPR